mgnify:CR=1 FL=1
MHKFRKTSGSFLLKKNLNLNLNSNTINLFCFLVLQNDNEARRCKSKIQKQCYDYLSLILKDVRKIMNRWKNLPPTSKFISDLIRKKQILIQKLEYFKNSHFLLSSIDKISKKSRVSADILQLYLKFLSLIRTNTYYLNYDGYR